MDAIAPSIKILSETIIIGRRIKMSLSDDNTHLLWQSFMPFVNDIEGRTNTDLISMQCYPASYFTEFNPSNTFEKWAGVSVTSILQIPDGLESYIVPGGLYAVFHYKGSSMDKRVFHYIFTEWLPGSLFVLDDRPHFEVLGEKYKNNHPDSEEDIWIPVKEKNVSIK